ALPPPPSPYAGFTPAQWAAQAKLNNCQGNSCPGPTITVSGVTAPTPPPETFGSIHEDVSLDAILSIRCRDYRCDIDCPNGLTADCICNTCTGGKKKRCFHGCGF